MNNNDKKISVLNTNLFKQQTGNATLAMSMVLLTVVTVIGITSSKTATNEIKMTANSIEKQKSLIAAESAVLQAWNTVNSFSKMDFLEPCHRPGIYDLRATATGKSCTALDPVTNQDVITSFTNNTSAWQTSKNPNTWDWAGTNADQHQDLADSLSISATILTSGETNNPMRLFKIPQFAIAIHEAVYRAGSTQVCFPVSIIGAAKGGVKETETLIEIRAIPPNSCFHNI